MTSTATLAPVSRSVHVDCDVDTAFAVFTAEIGTWWPVETHAIHAGAVREVVFEGREDGEVYEVSTTGERAHWARVTAWEPPRRVAVAWHVNPEAAGTTEIEVTFTPSGRGTTVELVHSGWERLGREAAETRASYEQGWPTVLHRYVERLT